MVAPISNRMTPANSARVKDAVEPAALPGKSGESVGQRAKAAIAASELPDLPSNIQGKIASMMARGLDYQDLLTPPPPPIVEDVAVDEPVLPPPVDIVDEVPAPAADPDLVDEPIMPPPTLVEDLPATEEPAPSTADSTEEPVMPPIMTEAENALALLLAEQAEPETV